MIPVLEAGGIAKSFEGTAVLSGISLSIAPGEAVGLFGANGSGKTTLVNVLSGLIAPDAGTVRFEGGDITRLPMDARFRIGISRTFQIPRPFPDLTVRDAVRVALPASADERAVETILSRAGILGQRHFPCARLSQGCLRRLEFARALACRPKLMILDEVFSALSATDEEELAALLASANREDEAAFLLVSHNPPLLKSACRRILYLEGGRIARERTV
ncbi:MAG: ATP-binding cassette domain-containing protein [Deltaproteobacteria bacterium]|nr:ATP-binding cassette domain-containing protein [Deltaproteobacteria bacterium]